MCIILLGEILENPGLAERLIEVLKSPAPKSRNTAAARRKEIL
jgi:hypothetical protein